MITIFGLNESVDQSGGSRGKGSLRKLLYKIFSGKPSQVTAALGGTVLAILLCGNGKIAGFLHFFEYLHGLLPNFFLGLVLHTLGTEENVTCSHPWRTLVSVTNFKGNIR